MMPMRKRDPALLLAGVRVLAVNDEQDIVDLLRISLSLHGAEVETATTASKALEIFERWQPDVLVSDLSMPGDSGFQLITEIRKRPSDIPAVAVSGLQDGKTKAISMGFSIFLRKPLQPDELAQVVAKLAPKPE